MTFKNSIEKQPFVIITTKAFHKLGKAVHTELISVSEVEDWERPAGEKKKTLEKQNSRA